jgi:hypothetical protein
MEEEELVNFIVNDMGIGVIAIGSDGSFERVKVKWPHLIRQIKQLKNFQGLTAIDIHAAANALINEVNVTSQMERDNIILACNLPKVEENINE